MKIDFLKKCLELAEKGGSSCYPNPMVGCIIVHNGVIIGEGFHQKYGQAHAEVKAINSVENRELLKDSTVYVSLEPCSHFGKTPPCADLLIAHKVKRVIIGCSDSFEKVNGLGVEKLRKAGIEVEVNQLFEESRILNKRFFTFHEKKRPFVLLKWAESKDGFFAPNRNELNEKGIVWLTQPSTKAITHGMRAKEHAILVGWKTILIDNPSLTVRDVSGKSPIRIVIDKNLNLLKELAKGVSFNVFIDGNPTYIFNEKIERIDGEVKFIKLAKISVESMLKKLYELEICSVMVEGGKETIQQFIDSGVWDEARVFIGQTELKNGITAPILMHEFKEENLENGDLSRMYLKEINPQINAKLENASI